MAKRVTSFDLGERQKALIESMRDELKAKTGLSVPLAAVVRMLLDLGIEAHSLKTKENDNRQAQAIMQPGAEKKASEDATIKPVEQAALGSESARLIKDALGLSESQFQEAMRARERQKRATE